MKFPATITELRENGYERPEPGRERKLCSCGEIFFWWISPKGKWTPFSLLADSRFIPHHATCKNVEDFRNAENKLKARTEKPKPVQEALFK